ncbi:transcription elongation factor B polypeptide 3 [Cylas formicarius]|uniref:transcription elongation factor B polypeptide 3 n=1 Tax=Cylas formicarius TaxID=197179 RepID=UPI00295841CF|nr:transcription elongation factor B polypeptide 3 [Cylas formicarius]
MGESNEKLLKAIRHYQESLDRHSSSGNSEKLLHALQKLSRLPIKMCHLEETGVGRTVNSLKKVGGDVGNSARVLVDQWKEMVKGEQSDTNEEEEIEPASRETEDSDEGSNTERLKSGRDSDSDAKDSESDSATERLNGTKSKRTSSDAKVKQRNKSDKHRHRGHTKRHPVSSESGGSSDYESESNKHKNRHRRHKSRDKETSKNKSGHNDKHRHQDRKKDVEHTKSGAKKSTSSSASNNNKEDKCKVSGGKHSKSSKSCKNSEKRRRVDSSSDEDESKKHKDEPLKKTSEAETRKQDGKNKGDREKHSKKSDKETHGPKSDQGGSGKDRELKKRSDVGKIDRHSIKNGIDSESGASFAEALGMLEPPKAGRAKATKRKSGSEALSVKSKSAKTAAELKPDDSDDEEAIPDLLKDKKLEPLDINVSSLLPPPNYKPLGAPVEHPSRLSLNDEDALNKVISMKNKRTKVYSGNKSAWAMVPSLFDLCSRILQDNLDALEYTGGVPYSILKHILEKANPDQLYMLEHHNPYLIDDTDELWHLHCQKEFRNKQREEMESWREMYMRCLDEREAKLKALTANIKQSQDKSLPVRTTKLAYVDDVAKPPRNIARKQLKNGTASGDKVPPLSIKRTQLATAGDAGKIAVPNPAARAFERSNHGGGSTLKPKKAPLMAKMLSMLKGGRFGRR